MTEILDAIELELVGAVRRHNAGARRRRIKAVAGTAVAALALGGATVTATVIDSPLDTLFPSGAPESVQPAEPVAPADAARSTVTATDDAGVAWDVSAYRSRGGQLATVFVPQPRPAGPPAVGFRSGLLLAIEELDGVQVNPDTDVVERDGRVHVLVGGHAAAAVDAISVSIGGERHAATLADAVVTVPVAFLGGAEPTEELKRRLHELPDTVSRRAFAVTLPSTATAASPAMAPVSFELTSVDGERTTETFTLCVSPSCMGR